MRRLFAAGALIVCLAIPAIAEARGLANCGNGRVRGVVSRVVNRVGHPFQRGGHCNIRGIVPRLRGGCSACR